MLIININGRANTKMCAQSQSLSEHLFGWLGGKVAAHTHLLLTVGGQGEAWL